MPYSDEPPASPEREAQPGEVLQQQRLLMDGMLPSSCETVPRLTVCVEQDAHLDRLSQSIGRQRDISLQINDELDVHTGLLEGLDHDLDRTDSRLTHARRRLDRVARGAKENGMWKARHWPRAWP